MKLGGNEMSDEATGWLDGEVTGRFGQIVPALVSGLCANSILAFTHSSLIIQYVGAVGVLAQALVLLSFKDQIKMVIISKLATHVWIEEAQIESEQDTINE